ncbi:MAG: DUF502 domain-containing protein [Flavobacteriales bacterium]|nr:DUF502 domain-containing protein [Flavobacteriales bacterium]MCB9185932.1 DUF502 domain-containing protein [Flavobacteriales bacterium]
MTNFFRKAASYFLQGLLFITPIGVTVFAVVWFVNLMDDLILPIIEQVIPMHIPGLGIIVAFLCLAILGYIISKFISISAINWLDGLMKRAPLVKVIYFSVKDLITVFFGKEDKMGKPVKVLVQRNPEQYKFGFVTRHDLKDFKLNEEYISVYFPYSYGVMGNQMAVRKEDVEFLDLPSAEVMKFIVSGGVVQKNEKK